MGSVVRTARRIETRGWFSRELIRIEPGTIGYIVEQEYGSSKVQFCGVTECQRLQRKFFSLGDIELNVDGNEEKTQLASEDPSSRADQSSNHKDSHTSCALEEVPHEPSTPHAVPGSTQRQRVKVVVGFTTFDEDGVWVPSGTEGRIIETDEYEDVRVHFDAHSILHWVHADRFSSGDILVLGTSEPLQRQQLEENQISTRHMENTSTIDLTRAQQPFEVKEQLALNLKVNHTAELRQLIDEILYKKECRPHNKKLDDLAKRHMSELESLGINEILKYRVPYH